jgi:hypothetical protein
MHHHKHIAYTVFANPAFLIKELAANRVFDKNSRMLLVFLQYFCKQMQHRCSTDAAIVCKRFALCRPHSLAVVKAFAANSWLRQYLFASLS